MYNPSTNWVEQIKFMVREMMQTQSFVLEGVVTSVDPGIPPKVKVMLEPIRIESGWLRVATPYAGHGCGLILPPPEEGTPVKVIFDMGDIQNGTVIGVVFNEEMDLPGCEPGSAGLMHRSGSSLLIAPDGTVTIRGKNHSQSW